MDNRKNKKKRILIFLPEFPVLTETFIARDISKLVEFGNLDINVLYTAEGTGEVPENLKEISKKHKLTILDSLLAIKYFIFNPRKVFEAYKIYKRDLTKSYIKRVYYFLTSVGYTKVFEAYNPDEIHVHFLSDSSSTAMVASIILDVPFSINGHARDITEYPTLPQTKARRAKFIVVCNRNAYERCVQISKTMGENIHLLHHGIDPQEIVKYPPKVNKPNRVMIFMGGTRLTKKKGIEYMVEASKVIKDRGANHEVHLIGPGPLYKKLKKRISELGLDDSFIIHGDGKGLPFSEVAQYYQIADIFALPVVALKSGDADGIPNVLIEAALAKLPIVTTDAGSVTELITDGETGVLVPQRDVEALATKVEHLIFDKDLRKRLGDAVYEKAKQMFSPEVNVRKLEELLLK